MNQNIFADLSPTELLQKYESIIVCENAHPANASYHRARKRIENEILSRMGEMMMPAVPVHSVEYRSSIERLRKERGLTQAAFAAAVGVSVQSVVSWEAGRTKPRPSKCRSIARVLRCSLAELFDFDAQSGTQ